MLKKRPACRSTYSESIGSLFGFMAWSAALLGWGTSAWLTTRHLASDQSHDGSGCAFLVAGDCGEIWSSGYAYLLGMPVSLWGLAFYSLLLILLSWNQRTKSNSATTLCTMLVVFALAASVWFVYLMLSLGSFCPSCALVHLSNVLLTVGWFGSMVVDPVPLNRQPQQAWLSHANRNWPTWAVVRGVAFAVAVVGSFYLVHSPDTAYLGRNVKVQGKHAAANIGITQVHEAVNVKSVTPLASDGIDSLVHNEPDAMVPPLIIGSSTGREVALFVNFTCEQCAKLSRMLADMVERFPGQLCIQVHLVPLERECNPAIIVQKPQHVGACQLAKLGYALAGQAPEKYQAFHAFIAQANGSTLFAEAKSTAEQITGQPIPSNAWQTEAIELRLQQDIDLAIDLGINNLPAIVVAGRKYEGCPERKSTLLEILLPTER